MKAVTIISPGFEATGDEAVARFRRYAGAEVDVLRCAAGDAHYVKLQAFADAAAHGWRWWFDADWWLVHHCEGEIRETLGPWVAGTPIPVDRARAEGGEYGYDPRCRVTTGFVAFDPTLPNWDRALRLALDLQAHRDLQRDELFLNAALHHFRVPVRMLDSGWNWCFQAASLYGYAPAVIHAIHAAGIAPGQKAEGLHGAAQSCLNDVNPWSLDTTELAWLARFAALLRQAQQHRVVEFGPGRSTQSLLEAGCTVTSCETDVRAFCIASASLPADVSVKLFVHEPGLGGLDVPCDWAFVDGPPGNLLVEGKSRWHVLDWCRTRCAIIVLHDAKRPGEQLSIAALQGMGWAVHPVDTPRGLCVLTLGQAAAALVAVATSPGC